MPPVDEATFRRAILELKQGLTFAASMFTLNVSSTTTSVTRSGVTATSAIHPMALSSNSAQTDIVRIVPASGAFVVTHNSSSVAGRTFLYSFATPQ
jgi:hypothetical protein